MSFQRTSVTDVKSTKPNGLSNDSVFNSTGGYISSATIDVPRMMIPVLSSAPGTGTGDGRRSNGASAKYNIPFEESISQMPRRMRSEQADLWLAEQEEVTLLIALEKSSALS